ncbi:MAG TPA: AraC family transcriptional regulator [Fimbriimonadaceae bacterium]|nr:AraC family transcriptional regulator [Fimbriimonadaceae bacterium]
MLALFADAESESPGTLGAVIQLLDADEETLARYNLVNGRHYGDASNLEPVARSVGDGTSLETVGACVFQGAKYRVDALTLDVPASVRPAQLRFKDLGSSASFLIFDLFAEREGAPERSRDNCEAIMPLAEVASAVRLGDRLKFGQSLDHLDDCIDDAEDLNEARGRALLFLGVVAGAVLETAMPYLDHRLLLETARELDAATSRGQVREAIRTRLLETVESVFAPSESHSDRLVDRALAIIERHFAKDITDAMVAAQLGLSTSHFRYLFRQATGHPFHKYLVALRLEKARQMLIEQELPVSQVAAAVGFTGLSHFSRAFTQRFAASPTHIRRATG